MIKNIELIQGYYKFLSLGKFLEKVIQINDLSEYVKPLKIKTSEEKNFVINPKMIKPILKAIHESEGQKNIYGFLTELSARRGIFTSMKEAILNDQEFHEFVKKKLGNQFFPFMQIISLARNILSHQMGSSMQIDAKNYQKQKTFLLEKGITNVHFKFIYSEHIEERKGNQSYGIDLKINMKNLHEGTYIHKILPRHELYKLSELCFNLSEIYKVKHLSEISQ